MMNENMMNEEISKGICISVWMESRHSVSTVMPNPAVNMMLAVILQTNCFLAGMGS